MCCSNFLSYIWTLISSPINLIGLNRIFFHHLCESIMFSDYENPFIFLDYGFIEFKIVLHIDKNHPLDHCNPFGYCL